MKILLIEDDLSTLNFIKKGLKESGYIVDAFKYENIEFSGTKKNLIIME